MAKFLKFIVAGFLACFCVFPLKVWCACDCTTQGGGALAVKLREVAADELTALREKVEDKLRTDVLSVFTEKEKLATLREVFNAPWSPTSVGYLWDIAMRFDRDSARRADFSQQCTLLHLLAFVATKYADTNAGKLSASRFDLLFSQIARNDAQWPEEFRSRLFGLALDAIADYGSSKLLGDGFWDCVANYEGGLYAVRLTARVADADTLAKLKAFQKACPWPDEAKEILSDLISKIESLLADKK